jgi:cobalt-zinc-cadmium efflux system outer membrane protein
MECQMTSRLDRSDLFPVEAQRCRQDQPISIILSAIPFLFGVALGLFSGIAQAATPAEDGPSVTPDSTGHGFPGRSLSLDDALRLTLERNPELLTARQTLAVSRARLLSARAFPNPVLTMQGGPALAGGDYRLSMGVDQEVPIGGKIGKREAVAQKEYERDQVMVQDLERRALGATRGSYRAALALNEKLRLARDVVDLNAHLVEVARSRFTRGEVSELDVRQFEVERSLRIQQMRSLASERTSVILDLRRTVGLSLEESLTLSDTLEVPSDSLSMQPFLDAALVRPGVRSLESERQAAEGQLRLERAERWMDPTIGVIYSRERSSFAKPIPMADIDNFLGAAIRLPLPLFYRRDGEMQEAAARAEAAQRAADAERGAAEREVRDAYQRAMVAAETYAGFEEGINAAQEAERLGVDAHAKGLINAVQLFQVQGQSFAVKAARLDAIEAYGRALSDLEEAAGMPAQVVRVHGSGDGGTGRKP